jgi:hypothetical protein
MIQEDRIKVLHGLVSHHGQWVPIDKKAESESLRRKKIEQGYVQFQGEWITIDEKCARVSPQTADPGSSKHMTIDNRQVYNIQHTEDNRSYQQNIHDHKHLHVDQQSLADLNGQPGDKAKLPMREEDLRFIEDHERKRNHLPPLLNGNERPTE